MTALANTAEGGTSGTTVTTGNSGGASGDAFSTVTIGATATLTFDNGLAAFDALSYKIVAGATAASSYVDWNTIPASGTVWFRGYFYFPAHPVNDNIIVAARTATTFAGGFRLSKPGVVSLISLVDTTGTDVATGAVAVPYNQWVRIEGYVIGSAVAGQVQVKLFTDPTSTTPTETITSGAAINTDSAALTTLRYGLQTYITGAQTTTLYMDSLAASNVAYIGPQSPGQVLIPTTDITTAGWTTTGGTGTASSALDETSADDGDFVTSPAPPTASVFESKFSTGTDPVSSTGHYLDYRIRAASATSSSVTVGLYQGATLIASETRTSVPSAFTTYTMTLTGVQADAITNYADLRIRVTATAS